MKPECNLTEEDGNVFNLAGTVIKTLKRTTRSEERCEDCHHKFKCYTERNRICYLIEEFQTRLHECGSYDEALRLMAEYVEIT